MCYKLKRLTYILFVLSIFSACTSDFSTSISELIKESSSLILKKRYNLHDVVYRQLTYGTHCAELDKDSTEFYYSTYDLRALGEVLSKIYNEKGFVVDKDTMCARMDTVFGLKLKKSASCLLNYNRIKGFMIDSVFKPFPTEEIYISYSDIIETQRNAIFYDEYSGLLLPLRCIPEVINVYSEFPDMVDAEKEMNWLNRKWSEDEDVPLHRKRIIETVYNMNKYFYTGNEENLRWLCKNAPDIVQVFFYEFWKEDNDMINKHILDKVRTREISIESLIAEKNEDGSLHIRDSLLTFLMNNPTHAKLNRTTIHQCLMGYLGQDIYSDKYGRFPEILFKTFNQNERREIIGHILNMVFKSYDMSVRDLFMHEAIELDEGLLQYYTDNDYLGLEYLRKGIAVYRMRFLSDHWSVIGQ